MIYIQYLYYVLLFRIHYEQCKSNFRKIKKNFINIIVIFVVLIIIILVFWIVGLEQRKGYKPISKNVNGSALDCRLPENSIDWFVVVT